MGLGCWGARALKANQVGTEAFVNVTACFDQRSPNLFAIFGATCKYGGLALLVKLTFNLLPR